MYIRSDRQTGLSYMEIDPYKQIVDEWLEKALYSALRILEKLREMGFDGGYSIVKAYVSSRKMDLNEKATVRFETMPGKRGNPVRQRQRCGSRSPRQHVSSIL